MGFVDSDRDFFKFFVDLSSISGVGFGVVFGGVGFGVVFGGVGVG